MHRASSLVRQLVADWRLRFIVEVEAACPVASLTMKDLPIDHGG
jgi:hypothetical protein